MLREHPQGAGPLVGAQMRYLIGSEHGWLGGFGCGAAALLMADRDRWIGWAPELRRQQMHRVVGMSRFLIRTADKIARTTMPRRSNPSASMRSRQIGAPAWAWPSRCHWRHWKWPKAWTATRGRRMNLVERIWVTSAPTNG